MLPVTPAIAFLPLIRIETPVPLMQFAASLVELAKEQSHISEFINAVGLVAWTLANASKSQETKSISALLMRFM